MLLVDSLIVQVGTPIANRFHRLLRRLTGGSLPFLFRIYPPFLPSIDIAAHLATDKHTALTLAAAQCATGILNTLPRVPLRCALLLRVNLGEKSFFSSGT